MKRSTCPYGRRGPLNRRSATTKKADALEHYGKAYAALADKTRGPILWKKIYTLYRAFPAKPSPPDAARRSMSRGQAAVENGKVQPGDFDCAIREFEQAALNAPAWPDAYYNLGMVQGKLERYDEAIRNLQKYLDLAPTAGDAEQVKTMIYQMEYRKEKAAKPQGRTARMCRPNRAIACLHDEAFLSERRAGARKEEEAGR